MKDLDSQMYTSWTFEDNYFGRMILNLYWDKQKKEIINSKAFILIIVQASDTEKLFSYLPNSFYRAIWCPSVDHHSFELTLPTNKFYFQQIITILTPNQEHPIDI